MEQVETTCYAPNYNDQSLTNSTTNDQIMTPEQVANFFGVTRKTVSNWTRDGKLNLWGIGGRRYYKYSELLNALVELKTRRDERK